MMDRSRYVMYCTVKNRYYKIKIYLAKLKIEPNAFIPL